MTLRNWMRNYLYIPLGGNKVKSKFRLYFNLWLVFLASGFWHGAAWTFIIWGIYHGLFLVLERAFLGDILKKIGKIPATLITFLLVAIGWVFFRADDVSKAFTFLKKLFVFKSETPYLFWDHKFIIMMIVTVFFAFFTSFKLGEKIQRVFYTTDELGISKTISFTILSCLLFMISLAAITSSNFNPFIYFRF